MKNALCFLFTMSVYISPSSLSSMREYNSAPSSFHQLYTVSLTLINCHCTNSCFSYKTFLLQFFRHVVLYKMHLPLLLHELTEVVHQTAEYDRQCRKLYDKRFSKIPVHIKRLRLRLRFTDRG